MVTQIKPAKQLKVGEQLRWIDGKFYTVTMVSSIKRIMAIEVNDVLFTVFKDTNVEVKIERDHR